MEPTPVPKNSRSAKWKAKLPKFGRKSQWPNPVLHPHNSEEVKELGPIRALWNETYEELKSKNPELVTVYEDQLRESGHGIIASMAFNGVGKEELIKSVVDQKLQQYKDDTLKVKALGEEFFVKGMAKPLIAVIMWADRYVGDALKTNPMGSIGWAGVMVFVPVSLNQQKEVADLSAETDYEQLLLNPSKQYAALLEGLDSISNVLVRSTMQEDLYIR